MRDYKSIGNDRKCLNTLFIAAVFLTFLRILLALKIPLYGLGAAMHDDFLLVNYADDLQNSNWLGTEYTNMTLSKGISFSFFLYICRLLFLPYPLGLVLLWILAVLTLIIAVKDVVKDKAALLLMYLFLLYSPVTFAKDFFQRIYRMAVIPAAVLLVAACLIGLFFRRNEKISVQVRWALGAGISLSFFWYIREDSIWLLPFVLGALLCSAVGGILLQHESRKNAIKKILVYILPIVLLVLTNNMISLLNYKHYGIYTVSDRIDTYFSKVMSTMLKVENENYTGPDDKLWISKSQIEKMVEVCPTLKKLEPQIEQIYNSGWCSQESEIQGEIQGDLIFWAFRDAVAWAGHYESAAETDQFYKAIYEELEEALNEGKLERRKAIYPSSMGTGIELKDIPFLIDRTIENMSHILTYEQCKSAAESGNGTWDQLRKMEAVTDGMLIYPDQVRYKVNGLIQQEKSTGKLQAYIKVGNRLTEIPVGSEFSVELEDVADIADIEAVQFQIYQDGKLKDTMDLETGKNRYCSIQVYNAEQIVVSDPLKAKSRPFIRIANIFVKVYQKTSIVLALFSLIGYFAILYDTAAGFRKKQYDSLPVFLIMTGLGISIFICMLGVSWFTAWITAYSWTAFLYTAGVPVLIQLFEIIGIYFGIKNVIGPAVLERKKLWTKQQ